MTKSANALLDRLEKRSTPTPPTPKADETKPAKISDAEKKKAPAAADPKPPASIFASAVATRNNKTTTMTASTAVYNSQSSAATANFGNDTSVSNSAAKGIKPYQANRRKRDERKKPAGQEAEIDNNISMFGKGADGSRPSAYTPATTAKTKKPSSTSGLFSKTKGAAK